MSCGLRPVIYALSEIQLAGFEDGTGSAGTVNGLPSVTTLNPGDQISSMVLPGFASSGIDQNFGERIPSSDAPISFGEFAAFPNMYGVTAGPGNLTGMTNLQVARFYQSLFGLNGKTTLGGPPRLDVKVVSRALATCVTNSTLAGRAAAAYGFVVTEGGARTALCSVGGSGDAFGVGNTSDVAMLDPLLATDERTVGGILYDLDGDEETDGWELALRHIAHDLYSAICGSG